MIVGSRKAWGTLNAKRFQRDKKRRKPNKRKLFCYAERNSNLNLLGYNTYKEYLCSDLWVQIRGDKLARFPKCILCDEKANQVHHLSYDVDTLLGARTYFLVTMCRECHEWIEFDGIKKRTIIQANNLLMDLCRSSMIRSTREFAKNLMNHHMRYEQFKAKTRPAKKKGRR